jgi:hypothetical protein
MFVYGWSNPCSEKIIESLSFHAMETGNVWMIAGITLSDQEVYFPSSILSHGIPDMWGASAVVYALIEGLAGVVDSSTAYKTAVVSPRWSSAGVNNAEVCVKTPASGGYVKYSYDQQGKKSIKITVTGNAVNMTISVLMHRGFSPNKVTVNGQAVQFKKKTVEKSVYVEVELSGPKVNSVEILSRQ